MVENFGILLQSAEIGSCRIAGTRSVGSGLKCGGNRVWLLTTGSVVQIPGGEPAVEWQNEILAATEEVVEGDTIRSTVSRLSCDGTKTELWASEDMIPLAAWPLGSGKYWIYIVSKAGEEAVVATIAGTTSETRTVWKGRSKSR